MKMKPEAGTRSLLVAGLLALSSGAALAHHSAAMFDRSRVETVTAVVREYQWANPHAWLFLTVADEQGKSTEYTIELTSPNLLMRRGWRPSTFKAGDQVTTTFNPFRDGAKGGKVVSVTRADGKVFTER